MKLTKNQLKQIIKEELQNILNEQYVAPGAVERGVAAGLDALKGPGTVLRKSQQRQRAALRRAVDRAADLSPIGDGGWDARCVRCSREEQVAVRRAKRDWRSFTKEFLASDRPSEEAVEFAKRELIARGVLNRDGTWPAEINFKGGPFAWADTIKDVINMASAAPDAADDADEFNLDVRPNQ